MNHISSDTQDTPAVNDRSVVLLAVLLKPAAPVVATGDPCPAFHLARKFDIGPCKVEPPPSTALLERECDLLHRLWQFFPADFRKQYVFKVAHLGRSSSSGCVLK